MISRPCRRLLAPLVVSILVTFAGISGATAQDENWTLSPDDEAGFVANINEVRAANGLGPLVVDAAMTDAARGWTYWMAENLTLAHADDIVTGAPADWLKVGENVGRGGTLQAVWEAFMASPSHAANVLDPDFDYVGIGVVWTDDGRLYTTHRFASTASAGNPEPPADDGAGSGAAAQPDDPGESTGRPEPTPAPRAPEPAPPESPEQLPFSDEPTAPPAEPARLAATMTLLLAAG